MITPSVSWSFAAVDGVNVQCPRALDAGVARIIGKRIDADGAPVLSAPTTYALSKREAAGLRAFFAKALRLGELIPGDAATAAAFGLKTPPPGAPTDG